MYVVGKRCLHDSCTKVPSFNAKGSGGGLYCKNHAQEGMVDVRNKRCSHGSCTKVATVNVKDSRRGSYCKKHAPEGMVNVVGKRCSHEFCNTRPVVGSPGR